MFAIYLFKFYFSNCTCSFVGNLMKFKLNTKQCDELTLGDDDNGCQKVGDLLQRKFLYITNLIRFLYDINKCANWNCA